MKGRAMLAPTAIDLSSGKIDTSVNNVAPTARIYLHLICRKRHLPLKLRKGTTVGYGAKFDTVLPGCAAITVSSAPSNRATRDKCIRSCAKAPLKKCEANTVLSAPSTPDTAKLNTALMYGGSFMVLSAPSTPGTAKLNTALMYGGSFTVLSVASTPGYQR